METGREAGRVEGQRLKGKWGKERSQERKHTDQKRWVRVEGKRPAAAGVKDDTDQS